MSKNPELPAFQQYQLAFAGHLRNPQLHRRPRGVEARRMKIYSELVYNNLESFLLACFPVLRKVMGKRAWTRLVKDFFAAHRCHTPIFRQIPDEFVQYLQHERGARTEDLPFLQDLAHYEWVELMLSVSTREIDDTQIEPAGDLLRGCPVLNPVLVLHSYAYPVHRISPRFKPVAGQQAETHFAILRNRNDEVKFIVLNPLSLRLLQLLQTPATNGEAALLQIVSELNHPNPQAVLAGGQEILQALRQSEVILGTQRV